MTKRYTVRAKLHRVRTKTRLAVMVFDDELRPACMGCCEALFDAGMMDVCFHDDIDGVTVTFYQVKPPHTVAQCRDYINGRETRH